VTCGSAPILRIRTAARRCDHYIVRVMEVATQIARNLLTCMHELLAGMRALPRSTGISE